MTSRIDFKKKCSDAAGLAENWMMSHIHENSLYGIEIPDPVSYYKWPLALYARGQNEEALRLFTWIMKHSLQDTGDLLSSRSGFHKKFYSYANLWLILAAIELGKTSTSRKLFYFLMKFHNNSTGGLMTDPSSDKNPTEDPLSTAFLGLAACSLNDGDLGIKVTRYINSLIQNQSENGVFWLRTDRNGMILRDIPPEEDPKTYRILTGNNEECYYFLGAITFFLGRYIETFGVNQDVKKLVNNLKNLLLQIGSEALRTIWAAKVAPGSVALFSATGDHQFLDIAYPVIDTVLSEQTPAGCWLKNGNPWLTVSAEQCYWLTYISQKL